MVAFSTTSGRSKFVDFDVPPPHITADPNLVCTWALDLYEYVGNDKASSTPPRRGNGQVRRGMVSRGDRRRQRHLLQGPPPSIPALVVCHRGCTPHEEVERIICERHVAAGNSCRSPATFRRPTRTTPADQATTTKKPRASPTLPTRSPSSIKWFRILVLRFYVKLS